MSNAKAKANQQARQRAAKDQAKNELDQKGALQSRELPTREQHYKNVVYDVRAAHYLLGLVLQDFPDVLQKMSDNLYDFAKEQRSIAIDQKEKS